MPSTLSNYGFVVDSDSVRLSSGAQFDWASVADSRKNDDLKKVVKAGTVVAKRSNGKIIPRADKSVAITSLTDDGSNEITAVATAHGLATDDTIVIEGADARFLGTFVITVTGANGFTYTTTGATSAGVSAGTLTGSFPAYGLLIGEAREDAPEHATTGYGVMIGGHFFENLLADATGTPPNKVLPAAYKA